MPAIITNSPSIVSPKTGKAKRVVAGVTTPAAVTAAAAAPATPATAKPAASPALRGLPNNIRTIEAQRTNFGGETMRDRAYLAFFASFAGAKRDAPVTLESVRLSGKRPSCATNTSMHPTDAGAINRLIKNGMLSHNSGTLTLTAKAQAAKLEAL